MAETYPYIYGALVLGLSVEGSSDPTLFVSSQVSLASLVTVTAATAQPLPGTTVLRDGLLGPPDGATARWASLRDPIVTAGAPTVRLQDDVVGSLARIFAPDPGFRQTDRWTLDAVGRVPMGATSFRLSGPVAPTVGQVLYLDKEAVRVVSVSSSGRVHTCTVARGACGSYPRAIDLDPTAYPPGDDGTAEALIVYSRPQWGDVKYEAALFAFRCANRDPKTAVAVDWLWVGHVRERPRPGEAYTWTLRVPHASQYLAEHVARGSTNIEIARAVRVLVEEKRKAAGGETTVPQTVQVLFSRYEAEQLFGPALHLPGQTRPDAALVTALNPVLRTSLFRAEIFGEVGGHRWRWGVAQVVKNGADVVAFATLLATSPAASINDSPVEFVPGGGIAPRKDRLNEGFFRNGNPRIFREFGERPPQLKVDLTFAGGVSVVDGFLHRALSGYGDSTNEATYDRLPGGWGAYLNPAWVSLGTPGASGTQVDEGTTEALKLRQILSEHYEYTFFPRGNFGAWLRPQLTAHTLLLGFLPQTGQLAMRLWARKATARPLLSPVNRKVAQGETLAPVRYLTVKRGISPLTKEFLVIQPIQLPETRAQDTQDAVEIEIWKAGYEATLAKEIETGSLARFLRATFSSTYGEPPLYPIPLPMGEPVLFADQVTWEDEAVGTAAGRGIFVGLFVLGLDWRFRDQEIDLLSIEDLINDPPS